MAGLNKMVEHHYHEWFGSPEPCPALYVELTRPMEQEPFKTDLIAALDTGAPLTAIPIQYKTTARLQPHRSGKVRWQNYLKDREPIYLVRVTADGCAPRLIEIIYYEPHEDYALIGRNLMKHWHMTLNGPEQTLQISESLI